MTRARNIAPQLEAWQRRLKLSDLEAAERLKILPGLLKLWKSGVACPYAALVETQIGVPVRKVDRTAGGIIRPSGMW